MSTDDGSLKRLKRWIKNFPPIAILGLFFMRILSGWRAYRKMLTECPPEEGWRIWFMDYDGSGDTYLTCGYLQSKGFIGKHDAFAASGGLSKKVAELFPFGRFTSVKPKVALNVRLMERFLGQRLKLMPLLYESDYLEHSGLMRRVAGIRGIDFMTMLKIGLEANCGVPFDDGLWHQPEFPYDPAEVEAIFRENGLKPGRTALIAPYAGKSEMWGVPMSFYEEITRRLQEKGYTVCTNSGNAKREPPISGTCPLLVPHRLLKPFCQRAGIFIALRSGLCDMVSDAEGCKKIILYTDMPIHSVCTSHMEFFSLRNMGLCEDTVEVELFQNSKISKI